MPALIGLSPRLSDHTFGLPHRRNDPGNPRVSDKRLDSRGSFEGQLRFIGLLVNVVFQDGFDTALGTNAQAREPRIVDC